MAWSMVKEEALRGLRPVGSEYAHCMMVLSAVDDRDVSSITTCLRAIREPDRLVDAIEQALVDLNGLAADATDEAGEYVRTVAVPRLRAALPSFELSTNTKEDTDG